MSEDEERDTSDLVIIQEIYDREGGYASFEIELERALEAGKKTIVIEPTTLGDETARWIAVGNCLHKTAVLSGFGSIITGSIWKRSVAVYLPLGALSLFCVGVYTVSWQFDPCCKYQVDNNSSKLAALPLEELSSATPVVLSRREDHRRKLLHNIVSLTAASICGWRLYQMLQ